MEKDKKIKETIEVNKNIKSENEPKISHPIDCKSCNQKKGKSIQQVRGI